LIASITQIPASRLASGRHGVVSLKPNEHGTEYATLVPSGDHAAWSKPSLQGSGQSTTTRAVPVSGSTAWSPFPQQTGTSTSLPWRSGSKFGAGV
jgi:hypothetical protein